MKTIEQVRAEWEARKAQMAIEQKESRIREDARLAKLSPAQRKAEREWDWKYNHQSDYQFKINEQNA